MGRAARGPVWRRHARQLVFVAALPIALLTAGSEPARDSSIEAARERLRALIEDVTAATAHRYRVTDDRGQWMDTAKIIWVPEASSFAAVYHWRSPEDARFRVNLATSIDLLTWTWQKTLAEDAAQATIAPASDGGYVVAWEQSPDPIHVAVAHFATWDDLRVGTPGRHVEAPVTLAGCAEGTPSIERASSRRVDLSFHFHAGCRRDRQAGGSTDWSSWRAAPRPGIDNALQARGARGHIGDRDAIQFQGHELMLIEAQLELGDPGSWRTFLYDPETKRAERLAFRSHAGTLAFANPTIERILIGGQEAILVALYVFTEGARGEESGQLIFYRTVASL